MPAHDHNIGPNVMLRIFDHLNNINDYSGAKRKIVI